MGELLDIWAGLCVPGHGSSAMSRYVHQAAHITQDG